MADGGGLSGPSGQPERIVAVKMPCAGNLPASGVRPVPRRAETAARLQHPNIVAIHAMANGRPPYFSMDYVAGRNLADLVRDRPLPAQPAARYVRKIAQAVTMLIRRACFTRDIKPANVLIDENDEPRSPIWNRPAADGHSTHQSKLSTLNSQLSLTVTGQVVGSRTHTAGARGRKKGEVGPGQRCLRASLLLP